MTKKYFEKVLNSISLVVMEMQIKGSMKLPSGRMPLTTNRKGSKCYWELKRDCSHPFAGVANITQTLWAKCGASGSLDLAQGTAIPLLGTYQRKDGLNISKKSPCVYTCCGITLSIQTVDFLLMAIREQWIEKMWYICTTETFLRLGRKWHSITQQNWRPSMTLWWWKSC